LYGWELWPRLIDDLNPLFAQRFRMINATLSYGKGGAAES
jgi:hypothetical protein